MKPNKIKISKIKSNPNNPRLIKDYKFVYLAPIAYFSKI